MTSSPFALTMRLMRVLRQNQRAAFFAADTAAVEFAATAVPLLTQTAHGLLLRPEGHLHDGMASFPFGGAAAALTPPRSPEDAPAVIPDASPFYLAAKRTLDVVGSLIGLLLFAPVYLFVAGLIALRMGGPLFHRRRVLEKQTLPKNKPLHTFDAFKFRTMIPNAEAVLLADPDLRARYEKEWKLLDDPRVTPLGRTLRKWSVDELPQLVNVLRGQMTLVGPRMISPPELVMYGSNAAVLLSVKPGLTGLWQVSGRTNVTYRERVRLDMLYIQNRSFLLDVQILFATVRTVFNRKGAI